jgi:hypothetical protein
MHAGSSGNEPRASFRLPLRSWQCESRVRLTELPQGRALHFGARESRPRTFSDNRYLRTATDAGILAAFLDIAGSGALAALRFARRYGPLELNDRGLPAVGLGGAAAPAYPAEMVEWYVRYARVAESVLELTRALRRGLPRPRAAFETVDQLMTDIAAHAGQLTRRRLAELRESWQERLMEGGRWEPSILDTSPVMTTVNWWLGAGDVRPSLEWFRAGTDEAVKRRQITVRDSRGKPHTVTSSRRLAANITFVIDGGLQETLSFLVGGGNAWGALGVRLAEAVVTERVEREEHCAFGNEPHWFPVTRHRRGRPCCGSLACRRERERTGKADRRAGLYRYPKGR